jgi:hypothetical protein
MKLFDLLKWLAQPVVRIALAVLGPLGLVLGAIADPSGALNGLVCRLIDALALAWPSTPENLKIANLIFSDGSIGVGESIVIDIFQTAFLVLSIIALVKLYKLIPFKMT